MAEHDLPTIDVLEAARRIHHAEDGSVPLIVDVRELDEFTALRVPGTVLLPISRFSIGFHQLPTDRPLLMLCRVGGRSASATDFLLRSGFPDVTNIAGGISAWHAAGLPTESGPVQPGDGDLPAPETTPQPGV